MGIKTLKAHALKPAIGTLKNLPTTWGLRLVVVICCTSSFCSEKPPHHMGIKTSFQHPELLEIHSEKPPHHTGIKTSKLG